MLSDEEEVLDLVNLDDQPIGTIRHIDVYQDLQNLGGYLRSTNLFLVNPQGQLWIPRRMATKKIAPNGLDYSAGGHVQSGESYLQAIIREAEEELHLTLQASALIYIGKLAPEPPRDFYFASSYLYFFDQQPNYDPAEFSEAAWLTPEALLDRLASGDTAKGSLAGSVKLVQAYLAEHPL